MCHREMKIYGIYIIGRPAVNESINHTSTVCPGIDVIGFSVGEPDFPTPEHIKQAGIRAIENDQTKYTPTPGTLALRQAVRKRLQEDWGLDYTTEEIVVSGGGKPILYVAV